jgi:protein-tyrosine-phosphatase
MFRVLFVCTANICRSPYMELVGRWALPEDSNLELSSAGTLGFVEHPMNDTMAATLEHEDRRGIDAQAFRSRRLTPALVNSADLVLTAEDEHRQFILLEQPAAFRKVFSLGQFATVVQRLDSGLSGSALVDAVANTSGIAQIRADVADPYRRGRRAAANCARQIDELLAVVLPALASGTSSGTKGE